MTTGSAQEGSPARVYQAKLDAGLFQIQCCVACGRFVFYPRSICPHCGCTELSWVTPGGRGEVYSVTVVRTSTNPEDHYNVCLIDLDEGVRVMSTVEAVPSEDVRIGMPVSACVRVSDGTGRLVFQKVDAAT